MGKIVSVCNNKGGVGKTTSNIHLAAALRERGMKILCVDLEYPGYFSDFYLDDFNPFSAHDDRIMNLFSENTTVEPLVIDDKLHILPSVDLLNGVDSASYDNVYNFREQLLVLSDQYDYVVIDSPPLLNIRLDCILAAADYIFVAIEPVTYSIGGLVSFTDRYKKIRKRINPALPVLPIIYFNKFSGLSKHKHSQTMDEFPNSYPPEFILKPFLRNRSNVADAISDRIPLWKYKAAKKVVRDEFADVFFNLVDILESEKWQTT
ncbi:MAG: ParA family protein [Marinicella sp.]